MKGNDLKYNRLKKIIFKIIKKHPDGITADDALLLEIPEEDHKSVLKILPLLFICRTICETHC